MLWNPRQVKQLQAGLNGSIAMLRSGMQRFAAVTLIYMLPFMHIQVTHME